jgi:hypothetical protein
MVIPIRSRPNKAHESTFAVSTAAKQPSVGSILVFVGFDHRPAAFMSIGIGGQPMKQAIRLTKTEEAKALRILLRHSPGMVLPARTYVLSAEAVRALRDAGIRFEELSAENDAPNLSGASTGARI